MYDNTPIYKYQFVSIKYMQNHIILDNEIISYALLLYHKIYLKIRFSYNNTYVHLQVIVSLT
jgi:hypothetical protein